MKKLVSIALGLSLALALSTGLSYGASSGDSIIEEEGGSKFRGSITRLKDFDSTALAKAKKSELLRLQQETRRIQGHQSFAAALPDIVVSIKKAESTVKSLIEHLSESFENLGRYIEGIDSASRATNIENLLMLAQTISEEGFGLSGTQLLKGAVKYSSTNGNALLALRNFDASVMDVKYHCEFINDRLSSGSRYKAENVRLFVSTDTSGRPKTIYEETVADALAQMAGTGVLTIANSDVVISLKDVVLLKDSRDEKSDVELNLFKGSGVTTQFNFPMAHMAIPTINFPVGEENLDDRGAHIFTLNCVPFGSVLEKVASMMGLPGRSPASFKPVLETLAKGIAIEIESTKKDYDQLEVRAADLLEKIDLVSK